MSSRLRPAEVPAPAIRLGPVLAGVAVAFVASVAAAAIAAVVVDASRLTEINVRPWLLPLGLACLVGGAAYAARRARAAGWVHGLAVGAVYTVLSLLLHPLLFRGPVGWLPGLQRLALGLAAGALGGVVGVNL